MVTRDISRSLVQERKHYVGARLQQGRVVLDSDFNENVELSRLDQRRVMVDVIGPAGSPDLGFSLRRPLDTPAGESDRLRPGTVVPLVSFGSHTNETPLRNVHPVALRPGSLYTGGLRFDLDEAESLIYQRDYLQLRPSLLPELGAGEEVRYLYYLRAWEQSVGALEDPELRDAMLRGEDTSTRMRRMRRAEIFELGETPAVNCDEAWEAFTANLESTHGGSFDSKSFEHRSPGRLRLTYVGGEAEDTCAPCDPFGKRYLGAENQTLRVMLTSPTTFVWTLDDPRLFRIRVLGIDGSSALRVELFDRPTEERDWPFQNRVVEIIPFGALLEGADLPEPPDPHYRKIADELGVFTRALTTYDPSTGTFEIDPGTSNAIRTAIAGLVHQWPADHPHAAQLNADESDGSRYFYMRVWHQAPTLNNIELSITAAPVLGTTGIQPVFTAGQRGDYWIAALRPEVPKEVVPFELLQEDGAPPSGPKRFYAPLAFLELDGTTVVSVDDCRPRIRPLNNRLCTRLSVGDGVHSFGDFMGISEAVAALPLEGGTISVGPGVYSEVVRIPFRNDVAIEGCGPSTIIKSDGDPSGSVFEIFQSQRIALRGFAIQARSQAIVAGGTSSDIVLEDLEIATGDFNGPSGRFRPGRGEGGGPQSSFTSVDRLILRNVTIRPNRQQGITLDACSNGSIEGLRAFGSTHAITLEAPPLLEMINNTQSFTVRDCTFRPSSQTGVSATNCFDIEFSDLDIEAGAVNEADNIFSPVLAPFDIDNGNKITLRSSLIRMHRQASVHPAVSVRGSRIAIEENRLLVDTDPTLGTLAWGGVHVRGGSNGVTVRGNRIIGGAGHGITLGSVFWRQEGRENQRGAPGLAQLSYTGADGVTGVVTGTAGAFTFPGTSGFAVSEDEGLVNDVLIADNRIEGFSSNGISALSLIGLFDQIILEVARVRIERNVIRDNLRHPSRNMFKDFSELRFPAAHAGRPFEASQFLPVPDIAFGGVVLASGREIEINDNVIADNGQTEQAISQPVSGIYILTGDAISIEGNRITNSGRRLAVDDPRLESGVRAGIGVMLAGTAAVPENFDAFEDFLYQPSDSLDNKGVALRVVNNSVIQPEGRALHAVAAGPVAIDGNYFASQGNHGNHFEDFTVGDVVYVQNLGAPWETFEFSPPATVGGLSSSEYAFEAIPHLSPIMLRGDSLPSPRWFTGLGGSILFVNNQVVYDWTVVRLPRNVAAPLSFFPNVLLGIDHTTVVGNQFAVRIEGFSADLPSPHPIPTDTAGETYPLYATLLAAGVTTNIELNRFSETILSTFLSLLSNGDVLNITTLNESTHRIASLVTRRTMTGLIVKDNLILIQPTDPDSYSDLITLVKPTLQEFLKLTFRQPR